ncbi:hypothetical protein ACB098_08G163700 [Castanea mollissima]
MGDPSCRCRRLLDLHCSSPASLLHCSSLHSSQFTCRSYHAQLLAIAQAEAEKKKKNPIVAVVDDKVAVNRKCGTKKLGEAQKKAIDKPEPETIVVISSEEENVKSLSGRKSRERSSRKEIKMLTAILTARSKVACGVTNKQDQIVNIDMGDESNDLVVAEYVDDIYKFYKLTEDES